MDKGVGSFDRIDYRFTSAISFRAISSSEAASIRTSKSFVFLETFARITDAIIHSVAVDQPRQLFPVDLRRANLMNVDLSGASLPDANLEGAILLGCKLREADLRRANLKGADLRYTDLTQTDLTGANLEGVNALWQSVMILIAIAAFCVQDSELAGQHFPVNSLFRLHSEAPSLLV